MTNQPQTPSETHRAVQEHYAKYAREANSCCESKTELSSCCGGSDTQNKLYPQDVLEGIPERRRKFQCREW